LDGHPTRFALVSRQVVTPQDVRPAAVVVDNGKIEQVVSVSGVPTAIPQIDVGHCVLSPGLVDAHVHVNEPGHTEWEGFCNATKAAAAGGVTCLIDMPLNSLPVTASVESLETKRNSATGKCWIDVGFYGGLVPGGQAHIGPLIEAGVMGIKIFLCDSGLAEFPNVSPQDVLAIMPLLAARNIPLLVHAELPSGEPPPMSDPRSYEAYLMSRPSQWEEDAIRLMIDLSQQTNCPVHIVHLATAHALEMVARAKLAGTRLTVETCPHYLRFAGEEISDGDPRYKCAPPIRGSSHRDQLWKALRQGTIDTIGSDHSPCKPEAKCLDDGNIQRAWGGISGLQFSLPAVWSGCGSCQPTLLELSRWMSANPARLVGIDEQKGTIEIGKDADLLVWDAEASWQVTEDSIYHRHKITPYLGQVLRGVVRRTYVRGNIVYQDGQFATRPVGTRLQRRSAL